MDHFDIKPQSDSNNSMLKKLKKSVLDRNHYQSNHASPSKQGHSSRIFKGNTSSITSLHSRQLLGDQLE
jgi:hypothetical protein